MAEGEELPPVVAALVGDDASFLEMIARDVEAAAQFKADLEAALGGSGDVTVSGDVTGADQIPAEMAAIGDEAAAAIAEPIVEGLAEAGQEGGAALAEGVGEGASVLGARIAELQAQISEMLARGTEEADAQVQALMAQSTELHAAWVAATDADFGGGFGAPPAEIRTAGADAGAAYSEGFAEGVTGVEETAAEFIDNLAAHVKSGALSAEQAFAVLSGEEVAGTSTASAAIARMTGTWASAQQALLEYGTAEASVIQTTGLLADAEDELLGTQTQLLLMTQMMAQGSEFDAEAQASALKDVADAEAQVTALAQAEVAALTELNYVVLQEEAALLNDAAAMRMLQVAAEATGISATDLTDAVQAGISPELNAAAATAQRVVQANLLTEAQLRLAAAEVTLIDVSASLGTAEEASATAQRAAIAGMASAQKDVQGLGGELGNVGKSAESAAGGMGLMANMMYGPLGMAMYPLMMVLPMLSGLFSSSAVSASVFTQAVTQDSNAVGDNTAATIQSTLASSHLNDISKQLGLSQAQLIEYAAGEKSVQDQVTASYEAKTKALQDAESASRTTAGRSGANATDPNAVAVSQLEAQKQALDAVTNAVAAAVAQDAANSAALLAAEQTTQIYNASVNALGESQLLQVQSTKMSNQATVEYGDRLLAAESDASYMAAAVGAAGVNLQLQATATQIANQATGQFGAQVLFAESSVSYMNAAMAASVATSRESALTSADASVGLLNLGTSQTELNAQLAAGETMYTEAQQGASAYSTALTSLNGTATTLLGTEASFTTSLAGLTTSIKTNGDSLDVNTTKGAANITAITGIATAAQAAAVAVYQNELSTVGANQAYTDANTKLSQEKEAFIQAADKAGMNKTAVQQLADELYKLPPNIQVNVGVNTSPAEQGLTDLIRKINSSGAYVNVYENSSGTVGSTGTTVKARASGGSTVAGETYWVGENGKELWTAGANGFVTPHEQLQPALTGGGGGGGSYGSGSGAPVINVTVLLDGHEVGAVLTPSVRSEAQQYKTRNSLTGFN